MRTGLKATYAEKVARLVVAGTLAGAMALPAAAWADEGAAAAGATAKDETVYVKAGADGAVAGIYVVNMFDTDEAEKVDDPAAYESVKNLSTDEALEVRDGAVSLTTTAGAPFYYQGTMDAATQLPWDIALTYYLDGEEVAPEALAGASGEARIVLDVQARTDVDGVADFANAFVLQAQGTFPEERFKVEGADGATLARSGDDAVVSCMVLPGESATFTIEGEARSFAYDGWQVAAMPLSMAIDLQDEDTAELTDATGQLEDATQEVADGSGALSGSMGQLSSGAAEMASGVGSLRDGVNAATDALALLGGNSQGLLDGWSQVSGGIGALSAAMNEGTGGQMGLSAASSLYLETLSGALAGVQAAQTTYAAAEAAYAAAAQAAYLSPTVQTVQAMDAAAQGLAQASAQLGAYQALDQAVSGYQSVDAGVQQASGAASQLAAGTASFDSGLRAYTGGVDALASQSGTLASGAQAAASGAASLASGAGQAASGAATLAEGAQSLADATRGLGDEVIDGLQEAIDEKLGEGFEAHSFVAPGNTDVDDVQFVYVIDGIEEGGAADGDGSADDAADGAAGGESAPATFWDRLVALFIG